MRQIEIGSDAWMSLIGEIVSNYSDGELIPHDWLKTNFGLKKLNYADFDCQEDFEKAIQVQQFSYMTLVDTLRWQLLEQERMYMKNVRGDGYVIMNPKDQAQYGYDELLKDVKKATREAEMIMNYVRPIPHENQSRDNDLRAKCAIIKQMFQNIRR